MRHIVLLSPSESVFSADVGYIGRFVVGALLLSHGARRDVLLDLVFDGEKCIRFDGTSIRNVRPDEQSLSGILKAGLRRLGQRGEGRVMQGINTHIFPVWELLNNAKERRLFYSGGRGRSSNFGSDFIAFFQFPSLEEDAASELRRVGFEEVNLGRCPMSPDQAVVVLNNKVDRRLACTA